MSLNQICGYDLAAPPSYIDGRFHNVFLTDNFNLQVGAAAPASELVIQAGGAIGWVPIGDSEAGALEHFQTNFNPGLFITSTEYEILPIENPAGPLSPFLIPDPLLKIHEDNGTVRIDHELRGIFMLIVKFTLAVISEGDCYQFRVERKFSENLAAENWNVIANTDSIVLNHEVYGEQSLCLQFATDSYGTGLQNTYFRFMARKATEDAPGVNFVDLQSNVTFIRIS